MFVLPDTFLKFWHFHKVQHRLSVYYTKKQEGKIPTNHNAAPLNWRNALKMCGNVFDYAARRGGRRVWTDCELVRSAEGASGQPRPQRLQTRRMLQIPHMPRFVHSRSRRFSVGGVQLHKCCLMRSLGRFETRRSGLRFAPDAGWYNVE